MLASQELYAHLLQLVSGAPYAKKNGGECNVGTKPCYVMEFLWCPGPAFPPPPTVCSPPVSWPNRCDWLLVVAALRQRNSIAMSCARRAAL